METLLQEETRLEGEISDFTRDKAAKAVEKKEAEKERKEKAAVEAAAKAERARTDAVLARKRDTDGANKKLKNLAKDRESYEKMLEAVFDKMQTADTQEAFLSLDAQVQELHEKIEQNDKDQKGARSRLQVLAEEQRVFNEQKAEED